MWRNDVKDFMNGKKNLCNLEVLCTPLGWIVSNTHTNTHTHKHTHTHTYIYIFNIPFRMYKLAY